ncbi:MAG: restriction endonuclease [Gemmatimonadaceae bacterium]|nr:restriction endonuclease [Gemmatimonadaceae bacterium]
MINHQEITSGEQWELFARDFLAELGFVIEAPPDRGADQGKDILATEQLGGKLANYNFRWLVSCKHNAVANRAVNEDDEQNILERMRTFRADGFLGFYSTLPSAGLGNRLRTLKDAGDIRDYRIFDGTLVENYLIRIGYAPLLMRFYPESYKAIKPLHAITADYEPLSCAACGKDLLQALYTEHYQGMIGFACDYSAESGSQRIVEVYAACKGACDATLTRRFAKRKLATNWEDVSDLAIPMFYLRYLFTVMNDLRAEPHEMTDEAFEQLKHVIFTLGQKVFRENTERERERVQTLASFGL